MARYWVRNDDSIEGPFEDKLLKFLDGFTEETYVCPDQPGIEEIWVKANEIEALREILGLTKSPEEPTGQEPPEPVPPVPIPEISPPMAKQPIEHNLVEEEPIIENPAPPAESPPNDTTTIPEPALPAEIVQPQYEKTMELHAQEPVSDFSREEAPVPKGHIEINVIQAPYRSMGQPPAGIQRNQKAPAVQKNRSAILAITGLAACASIFFVRKRIPIFNLAVVPMETGIRKFKNLKIIESWYDNHFNKHPQKPEQLPAPVPSRSEPVKSTAPVTEIPIAMTDKTPQASQPDLSKEHKPKKMKVMAKRKPAQKSAPKIVKKEIPPQKEAELKTQKYILPGVPAPNINQTNPPQESPNKDAGVKEPEKTADQEKKGTLENQKKESAESQQNQKNDGNKNNGTNDEELNEMERMTKGFLNQ